MWVTQTLPQDVAFFVCFIPPSLEIKETRRTLVIRDIGCGRGGTEKSERRSVPGAATPQKAEWLVSAPTSVGGPEVEVVL